MGILNDKNINTKGNKVRKIGLLTEYFVDRINNNQKIKRYLVYNTLNPLSLKGKGYDGVVKNQPDIVDDLTDSNGTRYIFNGLFDDTIKDQEVNNIFVSVYDGKFKGFSGSLMVAVNILVYNNYNQLSSKGETRNFVIAYEIENMLDEIFIDEDNAKAFVSELGNLKPQLMNISYGRLSNTSKTELTTMVFKVDLTTMKVSNE